MHKTIITLLLSVNFIFQSKAQIDYSWSDSLFHISPGINFDYLSAKINKNHIKEIYRRIIKNGTTLTQKNMYDENGILYENTDYQPGNTKQVNVVHINERNIIFININIYKNNTDTFIGRYVIDQFGDASYSAFIKDSLIYERIEKK